MTVPWPSHTLHGPRSIISPRQLHPLIPLQHSVSNLPEPPQPGQMISLCSSISTRLSVLYSLVPGLGTAVTRQAADATPKTARHRNLNRLRHHSRRLACFRRTSARPRRRRLGSASHPAASPIVPVADAPSRRSAALW